jgi:hypothetical protein
VTGKFFSQRVQILHLKLDQYANFQCPGIIGSILECGLLPMPDLDHLTKNQAKIDSPSRHSTSLTLLNFKQTRQQTDAFLMESNIKEVK